MKHCHDRNIMHRDIKPANIFWNEQGFYKLGDFGLSKVINPENLTLAQQ